jgi:hypothetical protein
MLEPMGKTSPAVTFRSVTTELDDLGGTKCMITYRLNWH